MLPVTRLCIAFFILVTACASDPAVVERGKENQEDAPVAVWIVGHGWHTGIVVPAGDIQTRLPVLQIRFGDVPYVEFGWGDKTFYQAEEITAGMAIKASLWPTAAVMHVVAVPVNPAAYFPRSEVHRLCLLSADYDALLRFIVGSFRTTEDGGPAPLGRGRYGDSQFYEALGDYTLFNTCNTWTAKGLKSAGLDIDPASKATASSVMRYVRKLEAADGGCGSAD
jgi:uncharacterized protein (TIGR02117 family)